MRASLLTRLIAAYLAPTLALLVFAPYVGSRIASRALEAEVGTRLVSTASAAAATLKADLLLTLQPGDEETRTYKNARTRLEAVRAGTHAERLYAFDLQRHLLVGTGDTLPIGTPIPALERDRLELERVLTGEGTPSSVTFRGLDGRSYKSGYAPLLDASGKVVAVVGADASAEFFDAVRQVGLSMVLAAVLLAIAGLALFFVVGRLWLIRPIRELRDAVERIGQGDLVTPLAPTGKDELATLSRGLEQMRGQLLDREREMQVMLAGIAHEVRNPLGGIELFAGLLAEDLQGDAEKLGHVRRVQRELAYLKRVVEDFLGYARDPRLATEPVELRPFLEDLAELVRPDAAARGQAVHVEAEPLTVPADANTLRRALLNLARNALQAGPEGSRVTLSAKAAGDRVLVAVQDEGPGVPEAERAQLFKPFHTTKEKGLGLGLAFVRRIAEAHGGSARLEPSPKGARFVVELPCAQSFAPPEK